MGEITTIWQRWRGSRPGGRFFFAAAVETTSFQLFGDRIASNPAGSDVIISYGHFHRYLLLYSE